MIPYLAYTSLAVCLLQTILPPELHLEIFDHLGPASSMSFALTCKALYALHWKKHGKTVLGGTWKGRFGENYFEYSVADCRCGCPQNLTQELHSNTGATLRELLWDWMGPEFALDLREGGFKYVRRNKWRLNGVWRSHRR